MTDSTKQQKPVPKILKKNGLLTWLAFALIALVAINSIWKHFG
ncbi:hypothetical protein [Burkholderia cenocepacia]|nr:hypothetical protein [Burkholderia cenocepacia]